MVRRALGWLGGIVLLLALATWILWLTGTLWTDRTLLTQYLYWGQTPLVAAAAAATLLGLVMSFAWRAGRRRRRLLSALLVIGLAAFAADQLNLRSLIGRRAPVGPGEKPLTLIHWNASKDADTAPDLFLGRLKSEPAPDVLILTAYVPNATRVVLARHMGPNAATAEGAGLLIYSRLPILRARSTTIDVTAARDRQVATAWSTWLSRVGHWLFARAHVAWRAELPNESVTLVAVTLDTRAQLGRPVTVYALDTPSNPALSRRRMVELLISRISALQSDAADGIDPPDILIGDFNTPRGSYSLDLLADTLRRASDAAAPGYLATWPRERPLLHIDHTFVSPSLGVAGYQAIDPGRTEHRAQKVRVVSAR